MSELVLERESLPPVLYDWLRTSMGNLKAGVILVRAEGDQLRLERLENVDPDMMERVRRAAARYRVTLARLADS